MKKKVDWLGQMSRTVQLLVVFQCIPLGDKELEEELDSWCVLLGHRDLKSHEGLLKTAG